MFLCVHKDSAGEPLYKLFRAIKHQIEKGPVDARVKKAKYTLNDTGLLGDDVEYSVLVRCARTKTTLTRKTPASKKKKKKSPHGFEIAQQTQSVVTVVTAQDPHRRLPAFVRHSFSLLVFSAQEEKEAAHSHVSGAHAWLQTARAGTRSPSLHQRVVWICVSVLEANVNAAISF